MELRVLQYFLAVAREENISAAAQSLHLTQPTLSRQLKELEEELGKQLMIRGSRKITLTEEGILLRKRAEEILDLVGRTEKEVMQSSDTIGKKITLTSIFMFSAETEWMSVNGWTKVCWISEFFWGILKKQNTIIWNCRSKTFGGF